MALVRGQYMRRQIMQLSWPVILEMLGIMLVSGVTTVMVGRLGAISLTAVGLATMVQVSTAMIFAAAGTGATAIVAREAGAGNLETLRTVAGQAVMLGFVLGTVLAIRDGPLRYDHWSMAGAYAVGIFIDPNLAF